MVKTNTPFLSLGSKGTVGGVITSQKRGQATLLRVTPRPTDPLTLSQQYQRWLYQDYAYLWTQQTETTRREYAAYGSFYHLTGFQYWMKYNLRLLPDIMGMWYLDRTVGAIAHDTSRNANHGVIVGASPTPGRIAGALIFDGLNDRVAIPHASSLNSPSSFSLEFFGESLLTGTQPIVYKSSGADPGWYLACIGGILYFYCAHPNAINWARRLSSIQLTALELNHICCNFIGGTNVDIYINGTLRNGALQGAIPPTVRLSNLPITLGLIATLWFTGKIDHLIYRNRALDTTEILRHSLRRYPL